MAASEEQILERLEVVATWHNARQRKVVDEIIADLKVVFGHEPENPAPDGAQIAPDALTVANDPSVPPLPNSA
jgi:hypothetical protein